MRNIISSAVVLGALAMIPAMTVAAEPLTPVGGDEQQGPVTKLSTEDQAAIGHAKSISRAFRAISKLAGPSVVSIEVTPEQTLVRRQGGRMGLQGMGPQGMVPQGMVPSRHRSAWRESIRGPNGCWHGIHCGRRGVCSY